MVSEKLFRIKKNLKLVFMADCVTTMIFENECCDWEEKIQKIIIFQILLKKLIFSSNQDLPCFPLRHKIFHTSKVCNFHLNAEEFAKRCKRIAFWYFSIDRHIANRLRRVTLCQFPEEIYTPKHVAITRCITYTDTSFHFSNVKFRHHRNKNLKSFTNMFQQSSITPCLLNS